MGKTGSGASDFQRERLLFAKSKWDSRHGNYLLQVAGQDNVRGGKKEITEDDARKIFNFIDYNDARVISKHQVRLLLLYNKDAMGDDKSQPNELIRRLAKILLVPEVKVFDEHLFAFFFMHK